MDLPILETERFRIRPFTPNDLDNAYQLAKANGWVDKSLTPTEQLEAQNHYVQWNSLNHQALANLDQPPTGDRVIELKATGEFIGSCGINSIWLPLGQMPSFGSQKNGPTQPEVSLMWAILPAYQGKGYATEVAQILIATLFMRFNLRRLIATTEYDNPASQRVMEKAGMRLERNPFPDPFWMQVVGIIENKGIMGRR